MIPRAGMLLVICLGLLQIAVAAQEPPVLVSPEVLGLAMAAAAATGIFFGYFPARRAAHLNPIDALRSE